MNLKNNNLSGYLIFVVLGILSLFIYKDYGMSYDEPQQRATGLMAYNYVFNNDISFLNWVDKDYGVGVELPLIIIEKRLGLTALSDIMHMRHIVIHSIFLLGGLFLFLLIKLLLRDNILAAIGFLLYVFHPRLYADSFYNSKDIPFTALYVIAMYWTAKAFKSQKLIHFLILGLFTALMLDVRLMGILLFATICCFLIIDIFQNAKNKKVFLKITFNLIGYIVSSALILYLIWPYLWTDPIENLKTAFSNMSKFRWDGIILLGGTYFHSNDVPWFYASYWIAVTTPIFILVFFLIGTGIGIKITIANRLRYFSNCAERNILLVLISFFAPLISVIVFHSVLYDGWRQLFFLYPSMVLLCILAIHCLKTRLDVNWLYAISGSLILCTGIGIVQAHPFENVYFNKLVPEKDEYIRHHFEMDYWGLSFKQSLEYILKHDKRDHIKVSSNTYPCEFNLNVLPEKNRIEIASLENKDVDYYITNFRYHHEDYIDRGCELHSFIIFGSRISTIYKTK